MFYVICFSSTVCLSFYYVYHPFYLSTYINSSFIWLYIYLLIKYSIILPMHCSSLFMCLPINQYINPSIYVKITTGKKYKLL